MVNVHHLELFFYVAKFEGITPAVRKMPYGIQQPAVSGQILQLEKDLGVKLFNRRPFALTPAGEELYEFIHPFFSKLSLVAERLRGEESHHLRLAASAIVLTHHMPSLLEKIQAEYPKLRLSLKDILPSKVDEQLSAQEIDLAVSLVHGTQAPGVRVKKLIHLPLVLLVPERIKATRLQNLCKKEANGKQTISEPLISLPPNEILTQIFQRELDKRDIQWGPQMEVNTLELVTSYVAHDFGCGLSVQVPGAKLPKGVRSLPLTGFPPLVVGLFYMGKLKPIAQRFAEEAIKKAKELEAKLGK